MQKVQCKVSVSASAFEVVNYMVLTLLLRGELSAYIKSYLFHA